LEYVGVWKLVDDTDEDGRDNLLEDVWKLFDD
jgi:hypothetical protein